MKKIRLWGCIVLFLVFTFFVFAPLDLYFSNSQELWFALSDIIGGILLLFASICLLLALIGALLPYKMHFYIAPLVFGIALALYLQGNYMNINYGVLDGRTIPWAEYTRYGVINTVIWGLCLALPLVMTIWKRERALKFLAVSSVFLTSVQAVSLIVIFLTTSLKTSNSFYFTDKNAFELGNEKNIIVFVVDAFGADVFDEIADQNPQVLEMLTDFTYYENTVGAFPNTAGAISHLLTGEKYTNDKPFSSYLEKGYSENILFDGLKTKQYNSGIYTEDFFASSALEGKIENIQEGVQKPNSFLGLTRQLYCLSAYRYFPHYLKKFFYISSDSFEKYKMDITEDLSHWSMNNILFYNSLCKNGLSVVPGNEFRFYHIDGIHPPYYMNDNIEEVELYETTPQIQGLGVIKIIVNYISKLQELQIYDNSTIFIMADHGNHRGDLNQQPLLLVKRAGVSQPFTISTAPISYDDFQNTLLYEIGMIPDNTETIYTVPVEKERKRTYFYYSYSNNYDKNYLPDLYEYVTIGRASDTNSFERTGKIYTPQGIENIPVAQYSLNEKITFTDPGTADSYFIYGLNGSSGLSTWSRGKGSKLDFIIKDEISNDLVLEIDCSAIYPGFHNKQIMALYANNTFVGSQILQPKASTIKFIIPKDLIRKDKRLSLKFEYPYAAAPNEVSKSDDPRIIAFEFEGITLRTIANGDNISTDYNQDETVYKNEFTNLVK